MASFIPSQVNGSIYISRLNQNISVFLFNIGTLLLLKNYSLNGFFIAQLSCINFLIQICPGLPLCRNEMV